MVLRVGLEDRTWDDRIQCIAMQHNALIYIYLLQAFSYEFAVSRRTRIKSKLLGSVAKLP